MIRDYWIYQERPCTRPWAIYIVREFERGETNATLDYTLYSEDIANSTHSKSKVNVRYETLNGYVNDIVTELLEFSEVDSSDIKQLEKELFYIMTSK